MNDTLFNIGQPIKQERVFFESYYPILFTCRGNDHSLYLCVCCVAENNYKKWLLAEVAPKTIVKMLKDEITIRDAFLLDNKNKYTIEVLNGEEKITSQHVGDWHPETSVFLPTAGEYIDADQGEFDDDIGFYSGIKATTIVFDELQFKRSDLQRENSEEIAFETSIYTGQEYRVTLKANVTKAGEYEAFAVVSGFFQMEENLPEEEKHALLKEDAPNILMLYIKGEIAQLTYPPKVASYF